MKKIFFLLFFNAGASLLFAQPNMQRDSSIAVRAAGIQLKFPWAGGLNFTNWGNIDLNSDGFKDLVVYDKSGPKIRTFINDGLSGQVSYTHNSVYEDKLPFVSYWFATYDYNKDGLEDIFTYDYPGPGGGIRVFRNAGNLQFIKASDFLQSDYNLGTTPLPSIPDNGIGIPGLVDMDGDGDMDIVVFDVQASNVEYHQNQSFDLYGNYDSLVFKMVDKCWGKFNEGLCQVQLDICPYPKAAGSADSLNKTMHAGSGLVCFDADGDGLIDLIEGDLSCDSLFYMNNKGTVADAHMVSYTTNFPPSKPVSMNIFPSPYFLDVNNDNKRDLIVAPNWQGSENLNNQWLYLDTSSNNVPGFKYIKNNFLQQDMIDLGEGAYPAFFDYEGDGDLDLLVGNFGYVTSPYTSKIAFFENTGTASAPSFSLITTDFANLSSIGLINMAPAVGDLDGDGDVDLLIGDNGGRFSYFTNTAGPGNPAAFSSTSSSNYGNGFLAGMDVGLRAYPQIIDLDKDGKLDIIAGNQAGKIYYYRNVGTVTTPSLTLISSNLGGVNVLQPLCSSYGNAMPFVFNDNGSYKMLVGSECGNMYLYHNIDGNLGGTFAQISTNAFGIFEGEHTAPALCDLNSDGRLDMMVGNYSGGLGFYRGLSSTYYDIAENNFYGEVSIFPNPAKDLVTLKFNSTNFYTKKILVHDVSGKLVMSHVSADNEVQLNLGGFESGMYFVTLQAFDASGSLKNTNTQKIIIKHE